MEITDNLLAQYNTDINGNIQAIHIIREQVVGSKDFSVVLGQIPDSQQGVAIINPDNFYEVFNYDDLTEQSYYRKDRRVYFHPSMSGKTVKVDYYGIGIDLISASSVYTQIDEYGNIIQTLEDMFEVGEIVVDALNTIGDTVTIIQQLKNTNIESANLLRQISNAITELKTTVKAAETINNTLNTTINTGNSRNIEWNKTIVSGDNMNSILVQTTKNADSKSTQLNNTIQSAENINENLTNNKQDAAQINSEIATSTKKGKDVLTGLHNHEIEILLNRVNGISTLLSEYPKTTPEVDDMPRLMRALSSSKIGSTLYLNDGNLDLNNKPFVLNKQINIEGCGCVLNNINIQILASNISIDRLNVYSPNMENAFQINTISVENIEISYCTAIAKSHCYLVESYNGIVKNITFTDCEALGGIHGFIAKGENVKFIRCKASGMNGGYCYGLISDNIGTNMALSKNNLIENCIAENGSAQALIMYARDYKNNESKAVCDGHIINGLKIINCVTPVTIGDELIKDSVLSLTPITNISITNVENVGGQKFDLELKNVKNVIFNNIKGFCYPYVGSKVDLESKRSLSNSIYKIDNEIKVNLLNNESINLNNSRIFDVGHNGTTSNKIDIYNESIYTYGTTFIVMVRGLGGDMSYGGFSSKFSVPEGIKTSLLYNEVQVTNWVYSNITDKFICTSLINTTYI